MGTLLLLMGALEKMVSAVNAEANNLNDTLCKTLDRMNSELDDLRAWRTRIYGAKSVILFTGILFAHAAVVLGAVAGLIRMRLGV